MRSSTWSDLYWGALTSKTYVNGREKSFVWCVKRFPALKKLKGFSILEVVVLAQMVSYIEYPNNTIDFASMLEIFTDYDYHPLELEAALYKNLRLGYIRMRVAKDGTILYYANRGRLERRELFEYNKWHGLRAEVWELFEVCAN